MKLLKNIDANIIFSLFIGIFFSEMINCMEKDQQKGSRSIFLQGDIRLPRSVIKNSAHELVELTPDHWSYDEYHEESYDYNDTTPLADAVFVCDVIEVQALLKAGADPHDESINLAPQRYCELSRTYFGIEKHKKNTVRCKQCVELILAARKLSNE